jgi:hypothetical protein
LSYDGEELIIKLFYKRTTKKDKFLGQSQMKIAALSLTKEPEWHFLTDKPEELIKQRGPGGKEREREREGERKEEREREREREKKRERGKKRRSNFWASLRCAWSHQGTRMAFF